MITSRICAFFPIVYLCSCSMGSHSNQQSVPPAPHFRLVIKDHPKEYRFVVNLISLDDRPLCLGVDQWPNELGQLDTGSKRATLKSDEGAYPARNENFGYCVGDACIIHVAPGSTLTGFIGYKEFGGPKTIARLTKRRLVFPVSTWICKPKDNRSIPR